MPAHGTAAADGDEKAPSSPPGTPEPPDGLRSPDGFLSPDGLMSLDELMPWSVRPLRTGRAWVSGPDPVALRARWERLAAAGPAEQERLFAPTRSRTP
ncbi:DNA methyltransferase, partial [Streptomyces anulatus]|nr:DNA methyltransferase [Streptomyces anulatus]